MVKKKTLKKVKTLKSPKNDSILDDLFKKNKNLLWLLPIFVIVSLVSLFFINNKPLEGNVKGDSTQKCKTGVNSIEYVNKCSNLTSKTVNYSCYDGSKGTLDTKTDNCEKNSVWQSKIEEICKGKSSCLVSVTPTISCQKVKLKGVSYQYPCESDPKTQFRFISFSCSDGSKNTMGDKTSCKSAKLWKQYASEECSKKTICPTTTPKECKAGLNSVSFDESCGKDLYRYVKFTCHDGTAGMQGGTTSCKSSTLWTEYAKKACDGKSSCKVTVTPSKSLTVMPTKPVTKTPSPTPAK